MSNLNKTMLIGRIGKDPETKKIKNDVTVTNFSLATNERWIDKTTGDKQERTEWHKVVAFNKLGGICAKYLSKGKLVYVEGKLQTRTYDKDAQTHYSTEIVASAVQILGPKDESENKAAAEKTKKGEKK